jgi:hypothetical protein
MVKKNNNKRKKNDSPAETDKYSLLNEQIGILKNIANDLIQQQTEMNTISKEKCGFCMECITQDGMMWNCQHQFHKICIIRYTTHCSYFNKRPRCPICKLKWNHDASILSIPENSTVYHIKKMYKESRHNVL